MLHHVVEHEVPEDRHAHFEGDAEGDVVQDPEAWGERGDLALGEGVSGVVGAGVVDGVR